ncbi:MAG: anthranilate phosphoribosyltransferase, partial [Chloroflexota bacterium]|nr:anthranilate phosphoribosyltransferase [Chloroflexota bacterium]
EIGIRTVFNLLGPLTNPAGANSQLIGVSDPSIGELMGNVLAKLGCEKALIVHGNDGLDEITLSTTSTIWTLDSGIVSKTEVSPKEFGIKESPLSTIAAPDPDISARIIRSVFEGEGGAAREVVLLNSAAALNAANYVDNLQSGIEASSKSIDSGSALASLSSYVELSKELQ